MYPSYNKVKPEKMAELTEAFDNIDQIENIVPSIMKRTFVFKGRKSPLIAESVIKNISNNNLYLFDPFAGSCSFLIAAARAGIKSIGSELDNYTFDIMRILFTKTNFTILNKMFKDLESKVKHQIMNVYRTQCCNKPNYIDKLHFDPENREYFNPMLHRDIKGEKNIILSEPCIVCQSQYKKYDDFDEAIRKETDKISTSAFPNHKFIENSRINITSSTGADSYDRNFTNRAKYALLLIQKIILEFDPSIEKDLLEHALVSSLALSKISQYGSGTEYLYHVIINRAQEKNVWLLFEEKYKNIIKFKKEYQDLQVEDISNRNNKICLLYGDYRTALKENGINNLFDIIYTDPPYTDQVSYLERSQLFRDWLNIFYYNGKMKLTDDMLSKEIVVTNAPSRVEKNFDAYYQDIDNMFKFFYEVLNENGLAILTIKLGERKYFKTLVKYINYARKNGFEYAFRVGIDKSDPTLRKQAAYKNTISNEMLVCFVKLTNTERYWYVDDENFDYSVVKLIYNKIKEVGYNNIFTLTEGVTFISQYLLNKYSIVAQHNDYEKAKEIITERFYLDNRTSAISIDPNKLYIEIEDNKDLFTKLYDIIPVFVRKLIAFKGGFTLDDLYFEILNVLCNGDPNLINKILESDIHQKQIVSLVENYCDMTQNLYVLKNYGNVTNENAVDISSLDGTSFEHVIKRLLAAEGYFDIVLRGGAGDRGVDLIAKKNNNGRVEGYIFQCKRWIADVGSEPIQRLHSMMIQMNEIVKHAICITTSNYTSHGKEEALNTGVTTVNGRELIERLNAAFPAEYYHAALDFNCD